MLSSHVDCLQIEIVETTSKEDEQQIFFLLKKVIFNSKLDWLSSAYSKALTFEILAKTNPCTSLMFVTEILSELR